LAPDQLCGTCFGNRVVLLKQRTPKSRTGLSGAWTSFQGKVDSTRIALTRSHAAREASSSIGLHSMRIPSRCRGKARLTASRALD